MIRQELNIEVRDSVFDPNELNLASTAQKTVYVSVKDDKTLYKVWLYLQGNDLPYLQSATYELHPTFAQPRQSVERSIANPNCQLIVWTWGLFDVKATIIDKTGNVYEIVHSLSYNKQLEEEGSNINYKSVDAESRSSSRPQFKGSLRA